MAYFKVRRPILATGGITVPGGDTFSASGPITATSTFRLGSGTIASYLGFGRGTIIATSTGAASDTSGALTVAGLNSNDMVIAVTGSTAACLIWTGASATAASVLTFRFYNAGSAATADDPISVAYLFMRGGT
jgi:hypothetical protein